MPKRPALFAGLVLCLAVAGFSASPSTAATQAVGAAGPSPVPAGGARAAYEASLGSAPRVYQPTGGLGHAWRGVPTYVAGGSTYSKGEWLLSDAPFDDSGADTTPGNGAGQSAVQGAATLPGVCQTAVATPVDPARNGDSPDGSGLSDLVEVRLAADAHSFYAGALLQTVKRAGDAMAWLRITVGGRTHVLILGHVATLDGRPIIGRTDVPGHLLEARWPRTLLPTGPWQVTALAGPTLTEPHDLAPVPDEPLVGEPNCWFEHRQSALLASGKYETATVNPNLLGGGYSSAPTLPRGPQIRLYYPRLHLGEGVIGQPRYGQAAVAKIYRGLLQPYALYVSPRYDPRRPAPLDMLLHCLNCTHDVYFASSWPGMARLGDDRAGLIATPLAYGEGGHYEGEAEWDTFEVLADVSARYHIDRDRLYLSGMSMGSLGTFRLGLLYPDLWARTFGVGNYTTPFCVTPSAAHPTCVLAFNYYDLLGNARNLPMAFVNGTNDELTPVTQTLDVTQRLDALGYPWQRWIFAGRTHDPSLVGSTSDLTSAWLGDTRRLTRPQHVTYRLLRATEDPSFALHHDQAYWLSKITLAAGSAQGNVDATSGSGQSWQSTPTSGTGSDAAGAYLAAGRTPTLRDVNGPRQLTLTTVRLSSLTIDPAGASLCGSGPLRLTATTDTPLTVTITGIGTLELPAGTSTRLLREQCPASTGAPISQTVSAAPSLITTARNPTSSLASNGAGLSSHNQRLATTGLPTALAGGSLLLLALALWLRRHLVHNHAAAT